MGTAWSSGLARLHQVLENVSFRGLLESMGAKVQVYNANGFLGGVEVEFSGFVPCRETGNPIRLRKFVCLDPRMPEQDLRRCIKRAFYELMTHEVDESLGFDGVFTDPHAEENYP